MSGWAQEAASEAKETSTVASVSEPAPASTLNVREFGAKGDGATDDRPAIQAAVDAATPGSAIYFPAGTYKLDDSIKVRKSNLTFYGDGATSVLHHGGRRAFDLGFRGEPRTGLVVQRLKFLGLPGLYLEDGNYAPAILIAGPKGTLVRDCQFQGSGFAVFSAGPIGTTYGTRIENCQVDGWGEVAIFCNGGERILNCRLIQDDPDKLGQRSSHGLYLHSGVSDVQVVDTLIQNVRKFAAQLYGQDPDTTISRIQFRNVTFQDCNEGIKIYPGGLGKAWAEDILVEDCTFRNIYRGPAIAIKGGDGIVIRNNLFEEGQNAGLALGRWGSSYEKGFWIANLKFTGNTIRHFLAGIYALDKWGYFEDILISGNTITDCEIPVDFQQSTGITFIP